jgi:hypothetical protein
MLLMVAGSFLTFKAVQSNSAVYGLGEAILMTAAFIVPLWGWSRLTRVLIHYAYTARIPVLIVMYLAFQGKWGTHYDAMPPGFPSKGLATDFLILAVFPQMFLWIAFTVLVGTLSGAITAAIAKGRKPAAQAA